MRILSIETSCDETAVSIIEATGGLESPVFSVLGNALFSQIDIHKEYGGVYPMLAKREHAKNISLLLKRVLEESLLLKKTNLRYSESLWVEIKEILSREQGLYEKLKELLEDIQKPDIDVIGVTSGPGLAPALWVGVSYAEALGKLWNIPVIPINHMEGHIVSVLMESSDKRPVEFPALSLLISGGHTELVEIKNWGEYKILGETLDDAVGEAYDKTARMLELPYPGGPEISKLAEEARTQGIQHLAKFPRPMIHSDNLNFSFSGLKTSVLYYIRDKYNNKQLSRAEKSDIAREFENAVVDVLLNKTRKALDEISAKTLIVAGGVIADKRIRLELTNLEKEYAGLVVKIPINRMSTDNALMIACATYFNITLHPELITNSKKIAADGNLKLK